MALSLGSVNLDNITGGIPHFALADNGYQQAIATPPGDGSIPPYVTDVITVLAHGADADALAVLVQSLDAERVAAARYWADPTEDTPVWLKAKLSGETGARQALVKSVSVQQISPTFSPPAPKAWEVRLAVERHPYWEDATGVTWPAKNVTAGASVVYDYTSVVDVVGDVPARLADFQIVWNASLYGDLDRVWAGLRSANKHGTLANFINIWECEVAVALLGTDAARDSDATASPGSAPPTDTKIVVTPGTATLAKRLSLHLDLYTNDYSECAGAFIWLLRYKVASGATWRLHLRWGYKEGNDADFVANEIVELTSSDWDFINCGYSKIPLPGEGRISVEAIIGQAAVQFWAERTAGAGALDLDCLCPIPVDEGMVYFSDIEGDAIAGITLLYTVWPNDEETSIVHASFAVKTAGIISPNDFRLPIGDGRMYFVFARDGQSVLTDRIGVSNAGTWVPRWLSLRGAE